MSNTTQVPDTAPGPYYVSVVREKGDYIFASGPYPTHPEALALVDKARRVAEKHDPRAVWYAFGICRVKEDCTTPGVLQKWGYDLNLEKKAA